MKERKKIDISTAIFFAAIMAVIGFIGGTRKNELFALISPTFGIKSEDATLDLDSAQNTYRELIKEFDGKIDKKKLIDGASKGLVAAAGDKHTNYMDAEESKEYKKELSGDYGAGIGVEIGVRNNAPTVIRPLKGNPAIEAGIQAGDIVLAVNGEKVTEMTIEQITSKIKGESGTSVKLKILRSGEEKEFSIVRAKISNPSATLEVRGDVAVMKISRFDSDTGALAKKIAQEIKSKNLSKIILDLRGNGGGYVTSAKAVASLWIDHNQPIMFEKKGGKTVETIYASGDNILKGAKTIVLIDGESASASEIVAGALRDYDLAKIYGEKSYGKGSVQMPVNVNDGLLKVTIAKWFTPKDKNIDGEGISPDKKVKLSFDDFNSGRDPQIEEALKDLK